MKAVPVITDTMERTRQSRRFPSEKSLLFGGNPPPNLDAPYQVTVKDKKDNFHAISAMPVRDVIAFPNSAFYFKQLFSRFSNTRTFRLRSCALQHRPCDAPAKTSWFAPTTTDRTAAAGHRVSPELTIFTSPLTVSRSVQLCISLIQHVTSF